MVLLHEKLKKVNLPSVIVANLWKLNQVLFRHLLVVSVPPLSPKGAASFHASVLSAEGCYVMFVFILDMIGSPVAAKQLDSILVSLWLTLEINLLSVEFKSQQIRGLAAQYFTQDTVLVLFQVLLLKRGFPRDTKTVIPMILAETDVLVPCRGYHYRSACNLFF